MKIKPAVLASLCMVILSLFGLWLAERDFAVDLHADQRLDQLSARVMEEKIKNQMLVARFEDFQQEVSLMFPDKNIESLNQPLRDLASVIPHSHQAKKDNAKSQQLLEKGKEAYQARKFEEASAQFLALVSQFPESPAQLEASYHLVTIFYQTGNKQESLNWAEKMLKQFPESLWTAKAMIVLADIYKDQNRKNDMLDVYQTILDSFNDESIKRDVKKRLSILDL